MSSITIGEFAARTRLSAKALRLYDDLGLLRPAHVDPANGYRIYDEGQVADAQLIAVLRRIDMPLATIKDVVAAEPLAAAALVSAYWAGITDRVTEQIALVVYLRARLTGTENHMHEILTRTVAARDVLSVNRHVHLADAPAFFDDAFERLRASGPGLGGIDGAPYLIFYGEVSDDSDGPVELCRPVTSSTSARQLAGDVQQRTEPGHDEVYIRLTKREMGWPAMLPAVEELESWIAQHDRIAGGPMRQVLIADQRTATADTAVCDLTIPLR